MNVLVTGSGGDIGQSIIKILKTLPEVNLCVGADIIDTTPSLFLADKFELLPKCESENYMAELNKIIYKYNISVVIPISEYELRYYTNSFDSVVNEINAKVLMSDLNSRLIGFDKFKTVNFLSKFGFEFPKTYLIKDNNDLTFPYLIKSKSSSGSKSIIIIESQNDINYWILKQKDFIAQEIVGNNDEELTCGLFRDKFGEIRSISFKRILTGGFSGYGEKVEDSTLNKFLINIAESLNLLGSINVQLRFKNDSPCIFEINPRFSSTVLFRHLFGFSDILWSLQDLLDIPVSRYLENNNINKFYKGFNEYVK
jgi:carbamoyl-phosphate synthase large subunit